MKKYIIKSNHLLVEFTADPLYLGLFSAIFVGSIFLFVFGSGNVRLLAIILDVLAVVFFIAYVFQGIDAYTDDISTSTIEEPKPRKQTVKKEHVVPKVTMPVEPVELSEFATEAEPTFDVDTSIRESLSLEDMYNNFAKRSPDQDKLFDSED